MNKLHFIALDTNADNVAFSPELIERFKEKYGTCFEGETVLPFVPCTWFHSDVRLVSELINMHSEEAKEFRSLL